MIVLRGLNSGKMQGRIVNSLKGLRCQWTLQLSRQLKWMEWNREWRAASQVWTVSNIICWICFEGLDSAKLHVYFKENDSLISDIRTAPGSRFAPPAGTRPGATWPATSWASTATTRPITRKNRFNPEKNRHNPVFSVWTRQFCRKLFCLCSRQPPTSRKTLATLRSTWSVNNLVRNWIIFIIIFFNYLYYLCYNQPTKDFFRLLLLFG